MPDIDEFPVTVATRAEIQRVIDDLYELLDLVEFGAARNELCAAHAFAKLALAAYLEAHDED